MINLMVDTINKPYDAFALIQNALDLVCGELVNGQFKVLGILFLLSKMVLITNVNIDFFNLFKFFIREVNSN